MIEPTITTALILQTCASMRSAVGGHEIPWGRTRRPRPNTKVPKGQVPKQLRTPVWTYCTPTCTGFETARGAILHKCRRTPSRHTDEEG